jgi:trimethylamine--corrinoid protein Co-methyltransferase
MAMRVLRGIEVTENATAVDAIDRVGPGGHFLMDPHTLQFMRSEFFYPKLADRRNRIAWEEAGHQDTRDRAEAQVQSILKTHESPGLPPHIDAAIRRQSNILSESS